MQFPRTRRVFTLCKRYITLPIVDFSKSQAQITKDLREAASSTGFFYLRGHRVQPKTIANLKYELLQFFSLPESEKMRWHSSNFLTQDGNKSVRGYLGVKDQGNYGLDATDSRFEQGAHVKESLDLKEVWTIGPDLPPEHPEYHPLFFAPTPWPCPNLEEACTQYYSEVYDLRQSLFQNFALALGYDENFFQGKIEHGMDSLNMIRYESLSKLGESNHGPDELPVGIGSHTDFEVFTILWQDIEPPGLEIYLNDEWHVIEPREGHFIVNIGDLLARWSNDVFRSTVHRARNDLHQERMSFAFFCCCNFSTRIESTKYPTIIAGEHMIQRVSSANESNLE